MFAHEGTLFGSPEESEGLLPVEGPADEGVDRVVQWFARCSQRSNLEDRFSSVLRQSIDEVLDGQRTGRYRLEDLEKTEKTYLGTKVEIICRDEFDLQSGSKMDYRISEVDVDAKFSLSAKWMIPTEAMGHVCLLMSADDGRSKFKVGLIRISESVLTGGKNKDGKRGISASGRGSIRWIFEEGRLQENILLGLGEQQRQLIFAAPAGQRRVDQVFMHLQGRMIDRTTVQTAARQLDAPKRVRDARKRLASQGIVILGHQKESPRVASALNLPVPEKGSWVSVRLVPVDGRVGRPQVEVDGSWYMAAESNDPPSPAPEISY